jgi:O-antigen ligase
VLTPLLAAAGTAALVACYQGFVDLGFLNEGFWEYMIRATGTLGDANKLGAVCAFWTIGALVFARRSPPKWNLVIAVAGLVLGIAAVWLSGTRTGLASVLISVPIAAIEAVRWLKLDLRKLAIAGGSALAIGVAMILVLQNASTHTIVQRGTLGYIPFFGDRGIATSANELLWERFGYGPAAIQMIKEHPLDGVGVGTFHPLSYDYGKAAGRLIPAPDNAQAWWRHNLAELGLLGFIPMVWWCWVFGRSMFSRHADGDRLAAGMLRGALIAFFLASFFGVPSQSTAITLTFWVFAFWMLIEQAPKAEARSPQSSGWSQPMLIAATLLIAVHFGATVVDAFGDLRPHERAQRFDWYYRYGFVQPDDVEVDPGGNPVGRRWTTKDALAVIPVKGNVLKFVGWIDHPDADVKPVHTQIWADSRLIYEGDLKRTPLFLDIPATPGKKYLVLEMSVDRLFRPSDSGRRDARELGLSVRDWVWE